MAFVQRMGCAPEMSIPTSCMASTATGFTVSAGEDPPEKISIAAPPRCRAHPAAIWERPALWVQRKRIEALL